jgi:hypothetical protein
MFGLPDSVIYSTSMGREHDSDPLVSRRGEDPQGEQPVSEAREGEVPLTEPTEAPPGGAASEPQPRRRSKSPNMLPTRHGRGRAERTFVRVVATGGIVGIGVAIAAIMASSNSQGWLIGLVVSVVSVVLAAVLWSSRVL